MADKGPPLPKFGEWDVNDPASAEGFTVIFNKARNEKKTGGRGSSPVKGDPAIKQPGTVLGSLSLRNGYAAYKLVMQNRKEALSTSFMKERKSYI